MADPRFDIVIAGGGSAGVALTCALQASLGPGLAIALIDRGDPREPERERPDPRCSALSAGSGRLLEALGVWPALAAKAEPVRAIDITDSSLEAVFRAPVLSYDNALEDGAAASFVVENSDLAAALAVRLRACPGVAVMAGTGVASFAAGDFGAAITLADGRTIAARLLVAADGGQSRLREMAGIRTTTTDYGQVGITAIIAHEKPHRGRATQHFLPAGPFAILPLVGNRACITWTEEAALGRTLCEGPDDRFLAEAERRFGYRLGALSLAGPRGAWSLVMRIARAFIAPRLALIGDAARTVHPIAGQGLNLALRDMAALTQSIADAMRLGLDPGSHGVLERYQTWRRFDSAASAMVMDALNRLFSNDLTLVRTVRDIGLGIVDRMPELKKLLVREAAGLAGDVPSLLRGTLP